jgi:formiminoglutamase
MHKPADLLVWRGRTDVGESGDTRRVWQVISALEPATPSGTVLLGFCSDEGVRRNQGREGAVDAPQEIRRALAGMAWHHGSHVLADAGDIVCQGTQLEQAQHELAGMVKRLISAGHLPIVLGGGHEVAFGTGSGVFEGLDASRKVGIINIDAHFDVRQAPARNSGTPFLDLSKIRPFEYLCIGVARSGNTAALFERVKLMGGSWILDEGVRRDPSAALAAVQALIGRCDDLYLSIDMDVLPSADAPGVSAPATLGIATETLLLVAQEAAQSPKLLAIDIAEVNPRYDIDSRTARLAARIVHTLIHVR